MAIGKMDVASLNQLLNGASAQAGLKFNLSAMTNLNGPPKR